MRANRHTLGLAAILAAMWYAGASQSNAAAYLLGFLTLSVAAISAVHAWSNLRGLDLTAEPIQPVYEQEAIAATVTARARASQQHIAIRLAPRGAKTGALLEEISAEASTRAELLAPPRPRGKYATFEVVASSVYPLGFFTAQRLFSLPQAHYVYPEPVGPLPLPIDARPADEARVGRLVEGEDFSGLREWHRGQSMRHVDWKAVARGQRLMVKQWSGTTLDPLLLAWDDLPQLEPEARLRQLARWVVLAERHEAPYALHLPGAELAAARGDAHFHRCMRALAEYRA